MTVKIKPELYDYLENLVTILFKKGYFCYRETARKYVDDLLNDIITKLPVSLKRPAPKYFDKYGKDLKYAVFRKNRNTHWYAFFSQYKENGKVIYLVCFIANNHEIAQYL